MLVAIDIETTGLSRFDCGIVQLSMIKVDDDFNVIGTWDHYLKPRPEAVWNEGAVNCSGITQEMVKDCQSIGYYANEILEFINGSDILTYNGNTFDIPFLQEELKREGVELILADRKIYDSYYIESVIHPRKLGQVYKNYTGRTMEEDGLSAHNSLSDVKATIEIFKKQKDLVDLSSLNTRTSGGGVIGEEDGKRIFLIGKYKGLSVQDTIAKDPGWITWLIKTKKSKELFILIQEEYKKYKAQLSANK